MDVEESGRG